MAALLTNVPIDVAALVRSVATLEDGAIVTFLGTARRHSEGKAVLELRYEAYAAMAEKALEEIVTATQAKWPGTRVVVQHRLGACPLGEASVAVVAVSPHRAEAFAACRFVIDTVKRDAPIWKQELFADGTAWVGDPASYRPAPAERTQRKDDARAPTRPKDGGAR
jgi:molybdopterin synthase catalytic subunit